MSLQVKKTNKKFQEKKLTASEIREKALNLLEYRAHSRKELFDKLKKHTDDIDSLKGIIEEFCEAGLIDDSVFAYQYAHDAKELKHWGNIRIMIELRLRGISDEDANNAIDRCEEEKELSEKFIISDLLNRKYRNMLSNQKDMQKVVAGLMRLGFSYGDIKDEICSFNEETKDLTE